MSSKFRSHIRASLADVNLQAALDANAERRIHVRKLAFASLAHPQDLRQQARRVRAEVIEHLDLYLEQFTERARINGMQVHYASDADQAVGMVLDIAVKQGAKLVAKSKTMVSEEIGLNHALEENGLEVIETDLGEYIVQLRGEAPSHIITPAVHLRRQDVGKLFAEKLGIPYTEDIGAMTNIARSKLRQVFMEADVGISGVNFGVAETGTLCVVTNEGNGRMVTTLPRTHIALMGIERLVPTLGDLSLLLSLLPRSATGQKLTVYTSLLNGPRGADDPDGPQERHVILVDNGRRKVRESELREILFCIRCGACLNACPVFREIGGHAYVSVEGEGSPYSGPMGSVVSPALFGQAEFGQLARASSLCGACREACPVDIDLPGLLLRVRAGLGSGDGMNDKPNAPSPLSNGLSFFAYAGASTWRFRTAQRLVGLFGTLVSAISKEKKWLRLPAFSGWGLSKDFPTPAGKPFHARYKQQFNTDMDELSSLRDFDENIGAISPAENAPLEITGTLQNQFSRELKELGAYYLLCEERQVAQNVLNILHERGIDQILAWEETCLPDGLISSLSVAGIQALQPSAETIRLNTHIRAGISGATAAVASTGSLLVLGGASRPLTVSLVPEIHIALVREKDIFPELSHVINSCRDASAAVLITGPSRTADIEMTLTIGVHGPGELHVICIKDR